MTLHSGVAMVLMLLSQIILNLKTPKESRKNYSMLLQMSNVISQSQRKVNKDIIL